MTTCCVKFTFMFVFLKLDLRTLLHVRCLPAVVPHDVNAGSVFREDALDVWPYRRSGLPEGGKTPCDRES